jgi:hypothetical protein
MTARRKRGPVAMGKPTARIDCSDCWPEAYPADFDQLPQAKIAQQLLADISRAAGVQVGPRRPALQRDLAADEEARVQRMARAAGICPSIVRLARGVWDGVPDLEINMPAAGAAARELLARISAASAGRKGQA